MQKFKFFKEGEYAKGANHSVFVTIYSRRKEKITRSIVREIPGVLVIFRSDGRLGLPGGRSEKKDLINNKISTESLKNTAIRETREEIGYNIPNRDLLKFESSILLGNNQITNFSYLVTDKELNEIYKRYSNSINTFFNEDEVFGLNRLYFKNSNIKRNIFKQNFKAVAKYQIESLINKYFTE